ncbi:heterodisulfide reductase, partial [Chloroflexota bacterium]
MDKERIIEEASRLLNEGCDGILGLRKRWGHVGPYLFTNQEELAELDLEPRYMLSPFLRQINAKQMDKRFGIIARGCDIRALDKLVEMNVLPKDWGNFVGVVCSEEQAIECNCEKPIYNTFDCTGCWKCIEKCDKKAITRINTCPIVLPNEFDQGLGKRKAIYIPFPQAIPLKNTRDAEHCLKITGKLDCKGCLNVCEAGAVLNDDKLEEVEVDVGSVLLTPGFEPFDAKIKGEYGYGRMPNVVTSMEFERILSASGPFQGQILRPSDGKHPVKIAWIQCVGSRDETCDRDYCSSVCCMYATKEAVIAREHDGNIQPAIFYNDIRAFGKGFERYVESAKNNFGIRYQKGIVSTIKELQKSNNLLLEHSGEDGQKTQEEFDMVVLSIGLTPSSSTK